jgi:hypothetical protein
MLPVGLGLDRLIARLHESGCVTAVLSAVDHFFRRVPKEVPMRSTKLLVAFATFALVTTSCSHAIEVRTMASPDVGFSSLHTFSLLPGPARRDGAVATGDDDPMLSNSIANKEIRAPIIREFQDLGYTFVERNPDFAVAMYASAREKLDVTNYDYGYPFYPRWWSRFPEYPAQTITQYTEGSVIVDVINPTTHELLWRGQGTAELTENLNDNVKRLARVAEKVVAKFPHAMPRAVAEQH